MLNKKTLLDIIFVLGLFSVLHILVFGRSPKEFPNDTFFVYDQLQKAKNLDEVKILILKSLGRSTKINY